MVKTRYIADGHPTFNRNPYNGYINPYYWVEFPIPYYIEIMGVDRPWHISFQETNTYTHLLKNQQIPRDRLGWKALPSAERPKLFLPFEPLCPPSPQSLSCVVCNQRPRGQWTYDQPQKDRTCSACPHIEMVGKLWVHICYMQSLSMLISFSISTYGWWDTFSTIHVYCINIIYIICIIYIIYIRINIYVYIYIY